MSYQAMAWATEQKLPSTQKLVLLMLANRINSDTGKCIPSIKRLADDCGLSESCVQRTLKKLSDMGLIKVHARFNDAVQLPNQYEITPEPISTPPVPDTPPRCTTSTPRVAQERTESGSLTSNITNTPYSPPEGDLPQEQKKKKREYPSITLKTFIEQCEAKGEDAIPQNSAVFKNAKDSGLPIEFLAVSWTWFKDKYLHGKDKNHKQSNWRSYFREAVNGAWGGLWRYDVATDQYVLTSSGHQYKKRMEAQEAAQCHV